MKKESYEFKDSSVELATEKGLKYLGVKRSDVEIKIKTVGGLFKKACVEIIPLDGVTLNINEDALKEEPKKEKKEKEKKQKEEVKESEKEEVLEEENALEEDSEDEEIILKNPPSKEDMDKAFDKAKEFIEKAISLIDESYTATFEKGYDAIKVVIDGENLAKVIGYRGETLDSLQYLASSIANLETEGFVRVQIDAGNYREKRTESLVRLANNMARRCERTKRPQKIEAMNSYERRIIHITLQSNEKVETESIGEGPLKEIVVKYKRKEKDGNVEVSEEITYGPSSDFSKNGTKGFRSFGNKRRRF